MINFKSNNWFDQYIEYRKKHSLEPNSIRPIAEGIDEGILERFSSLKDPFYLLLQQSGLIYGFPIHYPFLDPEDWIQKLHPRIKAKLILLDVMYYGAYEENFRAKGFKSTEVAEQLGHLMRAYYESLQKHKRSDDLEVIEDLIIQRVKIRKNYFDFRKSGINTHLFWDIYFFLEYCEKVAEEDWSDEQGFKALFAEKKLVKKLTLNILAAATHADEKVDRHEKYLYRQFKQSSQLLSQEEQDDIKQVFEEGITLDEINIPNLNWIARRFLLDLSLVAVHADADIDEREEAFLQDLLVRLELTDDDLLSSKAELGCFLYIYGKKIHFYKGQKVGIQLLGEAIVENFAKSSGRTYPHSCLP